MRIIRLGAPLLLLTALLLFAAAKKKPQQAYLYKPDQTADLAAADLVTAAQDCENWAMAAGLESMLRQKKINLDQRFWVMRLYGGEVCADELPSPESLAQAVDAEFVLDDGRHVRLQLQFTAGAPSDVDSLIASLEQEQIVVVLWHEHPYYLAGATYDERIGRDGSRLHLIKELRLANTFTNLPGVTFEKGRDNVGEIQGIISLKVDAL